LVVAFCGQKEAVLAGDKRSITFSGDCSALEEELYSGKIKDDRELMDRAKELGVWLRVTDGREKVWSKGSVLVGEVTEISGQNVKFRRIYLVPGAFLLVDGKEGKVEIRDSGRSSCVVLGNKITQKIAYQALQMAGRFNRDTIKAVFEEVSRLSASVSQVHTVLTTSVQLPDPEKALLDALRADCQESGWELCAPQ
jgi:hypothetical protein